MTWSQSHKRTRLLSEVSFSKYFLTITHKNYSNFQWSLFWETGNLDTLWKLGLWKEGLSWKPWLPVWAVSCFRVTVNGGFGTTRVTVEAACQMSLTDSILSISLLSMGLIHISSQFLQEKSISLNMFPLNPHFTLQ